MSETTKIPEILNKKSYVGRGIIAGKSQNSCYATIAYFITGRSQNSRNRIFVYENNKLRTEPFDYAKVEDPNLIIYTAIKKLNNKLIITNGDHTDTIYEGLKVNKSLYEIMKTRTFEPDSPNFTPRISCLLTFNNGNFEYEMNILKSSDKTGVLCNRYTFSYKAVCGEGHFISTYIDNGNPLPSFEGEPVKIEIPDNIDDFTDSIWNSLDCDNKISLFVKYISLEDGTESYRLINKNKDVL